MNESPDVPVTRRVDVVDDYHGTAVADPYRWLEAGDDPEVAEWVAAQNARTRAVLDGDPSRAVWHRALVDIMSAPVLADATGPRGDRLFCLERPAGAEQLQLTRRAAVERDEPIVLVDPAAASDDATVAIDWYVPSPDGSLIAVGTSEGGTEKSVLEVRSGDDGAIVGRKGDSIPNTRAASVTWEPDSSGFFYTRYPEGDDYHRTVHYHSIGSDWNDDPVVWADHPEQTAWPHCSLSTDGRLLLVHVTVGWSRVDVHVLDRATAAWTTVVADVEAPTELAFDRDISALVGVTRIDAGRGRVVRIPLDRLADGPAGWETLVAERDDVIEAVASTADGLVMVTSDNAVNQLWLLDDDGAVHGDGPVALGDAIAIDALAVSKQHSELFAVVASFTAPPVLWRVDRTAAGATVTRWSGSDGGAGPEMTVTHTSCRSPDGTEVGLFLIHRADITPNPETPTMLGGYGGFNIAPGPGWQLPRVTAWCRAGGLAAIAQMRGGSEHGEDWHVAGSRANKQNVFDDFHAAADHLVASGLTSRERLSIFGGSNGGLLVGAALTQRPDLCAAVVCAVPLLDMVRFPEFLIAKLWTAEYGDPQVPEEFGWVHAYSPYHRVVDGTDYPAVLLQTAEGDTRVDPLHARKMAARLQSAAAKQSERPILLFQEGRAGHGVGKPVSKQADSIADGLVFAAMHTGLTGGPSSGPRAAAR